eukprot:TRINITY_DN922_c0_g1_i6.p1 TRINITY_DN922_c0_g1~~TRINITY_DN922_c0_g1_i6.p1  ORF type:complete len:528 (-),score=95.61 TRINITY_DN922_c0_g1_i6:272-1855(-)
MSGYETISADRYIPPSLSSIFGGGMFSPPNNDKDDAKKQQHSPKSSPPPPSLTNESVAISTATSGDGTAGGANTLNGTGSSNSPDMHSLLSHSNQDCLPSTNAALTPASSLISPRPPMHRLRSTSKEKFRHHRTGELVVVEDHITVVHHSSSSELEEKVQDSSDMYAIGGGYTLQTVTGSHANEDSFVLVPNLMKDDRGCDHYSGLPSEEDISVASKSTAGLGIVQYFAVFDGHGGATCSQYLRDHLHKFVKESPHHTAGDLEQMALDGLKAAESKFFESFTEDNSGSCVVICMVTRTKLLLANIGDCRAVLCRRDGIISLSTTDHRAADNREKERIEAAGGFVVRGRVFGLLAVSRSIGDREYKAPELAGVVISEPGLSVVDNKAENEFVILASDGVWDLIDTESAAAIVRNSLYVENQTPSQAAKILVEKAVKKGSRDDVTAIVVKLVPVPLHPPLSSIPLISSGSDLRTSSPSPLPDVPLGLKKAGLDKVDISPARMGDSISQSSQVSFVGQDLEFESASDVDK